MRAALLLPVVLAACPRRDASVGPPDAAPVTAADAAPLSFARIDDAYHGTIDKLEVFVRLEHGAGDVLTGRYFYAKVGTDIALDGAQTKGDLALTERVNGKPTGKFTGTLTGDVISGTWSAGTKALPFTLTPIPRTSLVPVLIAKKSKHELTKTKPGPFGGTTCKIDLEWPELFGVPDAAIESSLNTELAASIDPVACEGQAQDHTRGYSVHVNRDGILGLTQQATGYLEGAAHPYGGEGGKPIVLRTGKTLEYKDVFRSGSDRAVVLRLEPQIKSRAGGDSSGEYQLRNALDPPINFVLEDKAVRFFPELPHMFAALGVNGLALPYDDLRACCLVTTGDVSRLWLRP